MLADIDRLWLTDFAERFEAAKANIERILANRSKSENPYIAKSGDPVELSDDDKWQMVLFFDKIRADIPMLVGIVLRLV